MSRPDSRSSANFFGLDFNLGRLEWKLIWASPIVLLVTLQLKNHKLYYIADATLTSTLTKGNSIGEHWQRFPFFPAIHILFRLYSFEKLIIVPSVFSYDNVTNFIYFQVWYLFWKITEYFKPIISQFPKILENFLPFVIVENPNSQVRTTG